MGGNITGLETPGTATGGTRGSAVCGTLERTIMTGDAAQNANESNRRSAAEAEARHPLNSADILGVRVDDVTVQEAVSLMEAMVRSGSPHHVVTVNAEFVMTARHHEEFRRVLANSALALPDGMGIVYAARLLGRRIRERVAGVDCVSEFAAIAAKHGFSLFLLGAAPGVAERTGEILKDRNPGLRIAGCYAGSPNPHEEDAICALIASAAPDILLVAYGAPKQDLWIARTRDRLRIPLAIGVGGTFDFIAGVARRAPVWIQKAGLEWLHRLVKEPSRWKRMVALPHFAFAVLRERLKSWAIRSPPSHVNASRAPVVTGVCLLYNPVGGS